MKIFLGISSFQVLAMFRRGLFYSYLTIYLKHFLGLSVTATSLFATLPMILNVLAQRYLWGILSDKYQKRRSLIICGEIFGGIGTILLWYVHLIPENKTISGWVIILGLSIIEIFWSMSNIGWSALISDIYPERKRGSIMGKLESIGGIGRIAGVLAGGLFYDNMGSAFPGWGFYHGALFFLAAGAMFLSVFPMFLVPEGGLKNISDDKSFSPQKSCGMPALFILFIIAVGLIHFGRNSVAITLAQYLTLPDGFNLSAITLSHVVNLRSIGIILAGLTVGILTQKTGTRMLLVWGTFICVIALFLIGITHSLSSVCIGFFLLGCSEAIIIATSYELASIYIPPESRARLFAIFNATFFLSWGIAGTFIAGPITDWMILRGAAHPLAYRVSFIAAAILTTIGLFLLGVLFKREKKDAIH